MWHHGIAAAAVAAAAVEKLLLLLLLLLMLLLLLLLLLLLMLVMLILHYNLGPVLRSTAQHSFWHSSLHRTQYSVFNIAPHQLTPWCHNVKKRVEHSVTKDVLCHEHSSDMPYKMSQQLRLVIALQYSYTVVPGQLISLERIKIDHNWTNDNVHYSILTLSHDHPIWTFTKHINGMMKLCRVHNVVLLVPMLNCVSTRAASLHFRGSRS